MGAIWLTDLADAVAASGLEWRTWPGWETRSRSSGGYNALWCLFVHHTASNTSPDNDCRYMWENASDRPIGALYLDRGGRVTVGAAGATNTQGKGGPCKTSRGTIPADCGNTYGLAIEAANAGTGEVWPDVQQAAYVQLVATLCQWYQFDPAHDVCAHFEWTDRKIDPAGSSQYASGGASWDMNRFRADVIACQEIPTPPDPDPDEGDTVTDDDIERIAQRTATLVWGRMLNDRGNNGTPTAAADLLRIAASVDDRVWSEPMPDPLQGGKQVPARDILRGIRANTPAKS